MGLTRCPGTTGGAIATKILSYWPFTLISVRLLVERRELARYNISSTMKSREPTPHGSQVMGHGSQVTDRDLCPVMRGTCH
jgi:hypothetical protein